MGKFLGTIASIAAAPFTGGASLAGTLGNIGSVLGAVSAAQSIFGGNKEKKQTPVKAAQAKPFAPVRPGEIARPDSLNELAGFTPEQQRSALATRGLNQGLGAEENDYYRNLIQRSLIGEGNSVDTSNPNFLMPIESQYFSQGGYNTSDVMEFLKGLSG